MERKIGEIFQYNGEWYQCVEDTEGIICINCCFYNGGRKLCTYESMGYCVEEYRSDSKSICFKKLEKVGEPCRFQKITIQTYKLYTEPFISFDIDFIWVYLKGNNIIDIIIKQDKEEMEEKKLNLKPFDIQKAREGKPVCTRDGRKARIICFDAKRKDKKSIIALVPSRDYPGFEDLIAYPNNGNYHGGHENDGDLMLLPEKKEGWVNVYKECDGEYYVEKVVYKIKGHAVENASSQNYVGTVRIEFYE